MDKTLDVVVLLRIKGNIKVFNLHDAVKEHSLVGSVGGDQLEITLRSIFGVYFYSKRSGGHALLTTGQSIQLN